MASLLLAVIYLAFISLGLPDSLLGAGWPVMHGFFGVPLAWAGVVSMIISVGTVVSSLLSERLTKRLGTKYVTLFSVLLTAAALLGFSLSTRFWMLCLWAVPYGLGAGSVDAALNNYVALHYASRHMSWLHCMWGMGASIGPYIMGGVLSGGGHWSGGYRWVAMLQIVLTGILLLSQPLWKGRTEPEAVEGDGAALSLPEVLKLPGAREVIVMFFCYSAVEQTASLWASSYLVLCKGMLEEEAAFLAALFFVGITVGRALSGFLTLKWNDAQMIRLGEGIVAVGVVVLLLPLGVEASFAGLILVGLGCAPIYPCIIHSTPAHFGADKSQAVIGVQMAGAYVGTCLMPPLFGWIANHISIALFPGFLLAALAVMTVMHERLERK